MNRLFALLVLTGVAYAQSAPALTSRADSPASISPNPAAVTRVSSAVGELPPAPGGQASLVGGTIRHLDPVRDKLTIQVFGGGSSAMLFDERTRVYVNDKAGSLQDLTEGQRVYAETVLDKADIFARSIHISTQAASGQSSGQIVDFDSKHGLLVVRGGLLPQPMRLRVDSDTSVRNGDRAVNLAELRQGTLVSVGFLSADGREPIARQISILAQPGTAFVFPGRVAYLDLHTHLLVVVDPRNNRNYEVYCDPATVTVPAGLREGASVTVTANFDGTHYSATSIALNPVAFK